MEPTTRQTSCLAKQMDASEKKQIALDIISNKTNISEAANRNKVSRKFIREQKNKGVTAIDDAFAKNAANDDDQKVLFYIPVTKMWLAMMVICLLLYARCSFRGVQKIFRAAFDYDISLGAVHNISNDAIKKATTINATEDLSGVVLGAHDEKFHYNKPILSGTDIRSLYCYLLSSEQNREGDTWAIHLWDLQRKKFDPERIFADDGNGLRAGHKLAIPTIPVDLDNFHVIKDLNDTRRFFRNRLKTAVSYLEAQQHKFDRAKMKGNEHLHIHNLNLAIIDEKHIRSLSTSVDILVDWMQHDVLNMPGHPPAIRKELYNFVLDEFKKLEVIHPHRITDICIMLEDDNYLALSFVDVLDNKFQCIADKYNCSLEVVWDMCALQRCKMGSMNYAIRSLPLEDKLGDGFDDVEDAVLNAMDTTERTSSMAENLHSRISPYLFLRREVGNGFLNLLRFYLNYTPFTRSDNINRVDKTPAEVLTGKSHQNWLEMLGFNRFKRAA
jgi:hypothetical protein